MDRDYQREMNKNVYSFCSSFLFFSFFYRVTLHTCRDDFATKKQEEIVSQGGGHTKDYLEHYGDVF